MTIQMRTLPGTVINPSRPQPKPWNVRLGAMRLGLQLYARVSPERAGELINRMFFTPGRLPMPSRYEYLLDQADSYTQLRHGPHTLPVYSWGEGPTVLAVHGWSGAGIQFGAYVEPLVKAGYRVVLFDAPAHGRAQGVRTDLYEMTEVIRKVGNHFGPVHGVIAHSLGSIAAARALVEGLDAKHLVMLAPPASLSSVVNAMADKLQLPASVLADHRRRIEARFGINVWANLSLEALAPRLTQRGLVVIDDDDNAIPAHQSNRVYHNWAEARLLRTQGLGHHRLVWNPEVMATVIRQLTSQA